MCHLQQHARVHLYSRPYLATGKPIRKSTVATNRLYTSCRWAALPPGGPADVQPTAADVEPTAADVEPTAADVEPTPADVEPTAADVEPTAADVEPTAADVESTAADVESTARPAAAVECTSEYSLTKVQMPARVRQALNVALSCMVLSVCMCSTFLLFLASVFTHWKYAQSPEQVYVGRRRRFHSGLSRNDTPGPGPLLANGQLVYPL